MFLLLVKSLLQLSLSKEVFLSSSVCSFQGTFRGKFFGGDKRDRTADLLNAIQALSQLSYTPIFNA